MLVQVLYVHQTLSRTSGQNDSRSLWRSQRQAGSKDRFQVPKFRYFRLQTRLDGDAWKEDLWQDKREDWHGNCWSIWKSNFYSILPGVLYCEGEDLWDLFKKWGKNQGRLTNRQAFACFHLVSTSIMNFWRGLQKTAKHTHTHTFSCRSCAKEFQALAREVGGYTALFVCCHSTLGAHQPSWQVGNDLVVKRGRSLVRNKGHAYLVTFTVDVSDRMISNVSTHHLMTHCPWVRLTFQSAVPLGWCSRWVL